MKKNSLPVSDIFLAVILVCLLVYMAKRTHTIVTLQSKSLIHELDHSFADQLYSVQRQARISQQLYGARDEIPLENWKQKIEKINNGLSDIEAKYSQNSPGVMLLGPIGTTSIILKEKELQQKLLEYSVAIGKLLHVLLAHNKTFVAANSIDEQIAINQQYIAFLLKKS
ncbi:MAG TPA: hypothetical protein VL201_01425 [Patescibacteria group bacterium]|jgi:hypothetical protein|nr:hypothetical protein [Patescibacteria group bacterium]